jgi:hypothetical protein
VVVVELDAWQVFLEGLSATATSLSNKADYQGK